MSAKACKKEQAEDSERKKLKLNNERRISDELHLEL